MSDVMRDHFARFARYNAWANARLYDAVQALPPAEGWARRKAYFGSILGTLNHILVGDRVWFARMTGGDTCWFTGLDQILHEDMADLRAAREAMDRTIIDAMALLPLNGTLAYRNSRGEAQEKPWTVILAHVFNHQTHHRGQVHDMLSQCGASPPALDLLYFPDDAASS